MSKNKIKKIFIGIFLITAITVVLFYFLAGDQIRYRDSRSNIDLPDTSYIDGSVAEISDNVVVEQRFINKIDRFKSISVLFTTHYRENSGIMTIEVLDGDEVLITEDIDVSKIEENVPVEVVADDYIEDRTGHEFTIRLSSNCKLNEGVTPLLWSWNTNSTSLRKDGQFLIGGLVFSAKGQEYIFTGQHYWTVVSIALVILAITLVLSYINFTHNRSSYVIRAIMAIDQYQFLISQLVSRDFKSKYKRSVLGVFWSFLNPLLTMVVQYFVFSTFFKTDISNYPVYLLSGVVCYSFFSECTTMCLTSISGNARLITKVYIPKYIFPLSRTISSGVNLGITLIPLILVSLITGLALHKSIFLILFFLLCLAVFSLGIGMLLATLMVFFRDIQFLWSVLSMIWMYATPIFYPASIIPAKYSFIIRMNPLYHFVKNVRICLLDGISPEPRNYIYCFLFAAGSLLIGSLVFKKNQDKFTLYL